MGTLKGKSSKSEPVLKTVLGVDARLLGAALIAFGLLLYVFTANIQAVIGFFRWVGL
jgi:hypothetical protein